MNNFLWGMCVATFASAAVFFARFWRQTGDRFFVIFAIAFVVLALNYLGLAVFQVDESSRHYFYLMRLVAFLFIIGGIVDKSRRG
jgi:hypothetical protein